LAGLLAHKGKKGNIYRYFWDKLRKKGPIRFRDSGMISCLKYSFKK
jgi:hypothetical protein